MADLTHEQLDEWRRFFADRIEESDSFPVGCYALIDMARRSLRPEGGDDEFMTWMRKYKPSTLLMLQEDFRIFEPQKDQS